MPRRVLVCLVLTAALGAAAWSTAGAADPPPPLDTPLVADLDGDGAAESVVAHETACYTPDGVRQPPCEKGGLRSIVVQVTDTCASGTPALSLSREMDFVTLARVLDANGDGHARELAFELRAGATARGVQAKIVSFRADAAGCVQVRRTLFSYPRPDTIGRRPRGTSFASGALSVHDFDAIRPGPELRTTETYARPTDAGCCPSFRRVTYWRFVTGRQRYTPYRTKLTRLRKPF